MDNRIRDSFDQIHSEQALKDKTAHFLKAEIQKRSMLKRPYRARLAAICASFVLMFIIGGFSYNVYFTPSAYIDMDVNPSIELTLNCFGRVIESNPYNDDGANILKEVDVQNAPYDEAVKKLLEAMALSGFLEQDGLVSVTVQSSDGSNERSILNGLQTTVDASLQAHDNAAMADIFPVTKEVKTNAHDNHVSPAKYLAISQLQQVDPTATFEDCRAHTISELNQLTRAHGSSHHGDTSSDGVSEEQEQLLSGNYETEESHAEQSENKDDSTVIPDSDDDHRGNEGDKKHSGSKDHH